MSKKFFTSAFIVDYYFYELRIEYLAICWGLILHFVCIVVVAPDSLCLFHSPSWAGSSVAWSRSTVKCNKAASLAAFNYRILPSKHPWMLEIATKKKGVGMHLH